jgi:hypothetical protein
MILKRIETILELNEMDINGAGAIPFSFHENEYYFLFGRETKDVNWSDRGLYGSFGGGIKKEKEKNIDGLIREFWEETNGFFGERKVIDKYIKKNFSKMLAVNSDVYRGVILFLPVKYEPSLSKYFSFSNNFTKKILNNKKEIEIIRNNGFLEKDKAKWMKIDDIQKNMKKFRNCEKELVDFIIEHFTSDFTELYQIEPM